MKQLLILSGKGGTGKTTVAGAFIKLNKSKAYADCDVDAPNLHLIMQNENEPVKKDFYGMPKAEIDKEVCISCGKCFKECRFDAIVKDDVYEVDPFSCEGCGLCEYICPVNAVKMVDSVSGELILYKNQEVFSTAMLKMGSGNSGLLVTEVKNQMKDNAVNCDTSIIDGSPGIGCPVIASVTGVDMVLIVTEPSLSGLSDMERILKTVKVFNTKSAVCINKYDTNPEISDKIIEFCNKNEISYVGSIPYDRDAYRLTNRGLSIVESDCDSGRAVKEVYLNTIKLLNKT